MKKVLCFVTVVSLFCVMFAGCVTPENIVNDKLEWDESYVAPELVDYELNEEGNHVANIPYEDIFDGSEDYSFEGKQVFPVENFGAGVDKSVEENTVAINNALVEAGKVNGVVSVTNGTYNTGTINMQSNVTLYIDSDSTLKFASYSYFSSAEERNKYLVYSLICASNVQNWRICGEGKLDGNGTSYTKAPEDASLFMPMETFNLKERVLEYRARIRERIVDEIGYHIIYTYNSTDFVIKNITIYEPSTWTVKLDRSSNITIQNVVIDNNIYIANSDGIDIYGSSDVKIDNCFIATADDGIVLKSPVAEVKNVTITNCQIMSLANNFKIGTETGYDVSNITVKDCKFFTCGINGGYSGLAIESADGANISNVVIDNIQMKNVNSAIFIWLGSRLDKDKGSDGRTMGSVQNIKISNVYAKDVDIACAIVGCDYRGNAYNVEQVELTNINIEYREAQEDLDIYKGNQVLKANMNGYPEITRVSHMYIGSHEGSLYHDLPYYGLYVCNVSGLTIDGFRVKPRSCNTRPASNLASYADGLSDIVIK